MREAVAFWRHPQFRLAVVDFLPPSLGIGAWGVMTGVAIVKAGLGPLETLAMSTIVFAGSSQLAALPLMAAGAPIAVVFATAFCVNLRFVVFSLHLRPYVMHLPLARRVLYGYLIADISYVLMLRRHPTPPVIADDVAALEAYWLGTGLFGWVVWTATTLVGVALGNAVPAQWGLGFAGILALVGVAMSLVTSRLRIVSAVVAGGAAIVAIGLPDRLGIVVAIATAVAACLALDKARRMHGARARGSA